MPLTPLLFDATVIALMFLGGPIAWLLCSVIVMIELKISFKDAWCRKYDIPEGF